MIVSDIPSAVSFYEGLGFEETFRNDTVYSVLRLGGMFMHLAVRDEIPGGGVSLALIEIENVHRYYEFCIAQNVTFDREIADQFYGLRSFVLKNHDGNIIEIAEEIKKQP